jgi:tetratricopeptide (TPR) repeat protein
LSDDFTYDVFISYSHRDADWVQTWLLPRLEAAGLRVCIDDRDFEVGTPSLVNMENAARNSRKTLLVMTPNWALSEWTDFEALLTQTRDPAGRRRRLVPLLLKACDLPDRLSIFTHADFTDPAKWDAELARVVNSLRPAQTPRPSGRQALPPNLVHPYPMQANFTGRRDECRELSAWLADDAHPVCALVAMGGMGKSALAWHWLTHDVLTAAAPDGVMWWSFYEGESSFAKFIDDAFRYVTDQPAIDAERFPTTYDRAQELRRLLQTRRVLFILDGFERQLRAYARLDAAYQPDDAAATSREARDCVDPVTARWLRGVTSGPTRAKVLLTTRLMPHDLEDRAGDPLAGVLGRELKALPRDDAVAFMRSQGVTKGTRAEIAAACEDYGYHPLSLRLLSGLIARDARTPGDIAAAPRHDVHADLVQRQHHILQQSYDALPEEERALLSRLAAFRNPTTYDTLTIFNERGDDASFDAALEDLRVRGLLQRDFKNNRYDLHPLVRRYAYDRLTDKTTVHARLRDYFAGLPMPEPRQVRGLEDLTPVIELYYHTVGAGQYDEAAELFYSRISQMLFFRFGAYQTQIELLRLLFPEREDHPPLLDDESWQRWGLHQLANSYGFTGQLQNAIRVYQQSIAIAGRREGRKSLAISLGAAASIGHLPLGELTVAERNLRKRIEMCHELKDRFEEGVGHWDLGELLTYHGAFDEAAEELDKAIKLFDELNQVQSLCGVWVCRAARALLMGDARAALEAARRSFEYWEKCAKEYFPVERDLVHIKFLLGAALVMEGKDLSAAETHLTGALTRCRRINLVEVEPKILLAWARWHRARGDASEARAYADEALAIAERCEFRLAQAEIHNFLARLAWDAGEREEAREEAERARERAWCDGPPYCYKPALEEAEGMLRELGVDESVLSSPPAAR